MDGARLRTLPIKGARLPYKGHASDLAATPIGAARRGAEEGMRAEGAMNARVEVGGRVWRMGRVRGVGRA